MAAEPKPDPAPAPPVILVVEDDGATARILQHILVREGYEVQVSRDGRDAIARVGSSPVPMLILLDLLLPYVDGTEVIRAIRGNLPWSGVPVIVLTAKTGEEDVVEALDSGATDFVRKPVRPEELLARVRRCLRSGA